MIKSLRNLVLAISTLYLSSYAVAAGDPTGSWKFSAAAGERTLESTLTLNWKDGKLTGTINNQAGKVDITEARFVDDQVSFTVVREIGKRLRKKTFKVDYAGKLEGDVIKGTLETTGRDKQPVSLPWEAQRVK